MGATVPLAVAVLSRFGRDLHESLGRLYLLNTLGGAVGVALGPFVLLPGLGIRGAFLVAGLANLLVGMVAWRWSQDIPFPTPPSPPAAGAAGTAETARQRAPLFAGLAAASGAFTFGIEVIWTRSLVLVLGSSVYAFGSMLLAVLVGIAVGSLAYGRLRPKIRNPGLLLGRLFLACGLLALLGAVAIGRLPGAFLALIKALPVSFSAHVLAGLALALAALLPVTSLLGMTFPLLLHVAGGTGAQRPTGRLYAWNTSGAVAGALLADLVLVRAYGLQGSYLVLAGLLLAAGTAALLAPRGWRTGLIAAAAVAVGAAVLAPRFRPWDEVAMTAGVFEYGLEWKDRPGFDLADLRRERRLLFYEEGREAVVAVAEPSGSSRRFLSINGKTDAGSGAEDVLTQKLIAHVPLLLHEAPRRALVVGWGAGATAAAAALHPLERLECVEIEPATFAAAPFFEALSGAVRRDPRFRIVFRDGRTHLLRAEGRYDVIVSEPSNPWISGVANLFTREFYEVALSRLARGGVFGQWFHYYRLEPQDVKVELMTFASVFPEVSLWLVPPVGGESGPHLAADLLLVGSRQPHALEWTRLRQAFRGEVGADLRSSGVIRDEAALVASWAMGGEALRRYARDPAFPRGTPLNTDDHPLLELVAPRRKILPPSEVVRRAQAQYGALAAVGRPEDLPLRGLPATEAAAFWQALGERYAETVQPDRATFALERSLALDPAREGAWEALGLASLDRRDFVRAENAHRQLLRLRPRDVPAWLRLAAALARQSKWAEAREALRRARALEPEAQVDPALLEFVERQAAQKAE
jgi:spermidine synthase